MADAPPPTGPATPPRQRGGAGSTGGGRTPKGDRGGRGRGQGQNRGRGRGRGGYAPHNGNESTAATSPPANIRGGGRFGGRLSDAQSQPQAEHARGKQPAAQPTTAIVTEEDDEEKELCFICASETDHYAVAPCNHRTCHVCALRMRALFKTRTCLHCRTNSDWVIFTDEPERRYEEFADRDVMEKDLALGIKYEKPELREDTHFLLRYNCPDAECEVACLGWPDLHRHVRSVHQKVMCDLCTRNKKAFTHEHELFTPADLKKHERFGDDHPGAIDQTGFKGHPECGFCRQRFYGDDELYAHCRDRHEKCHICDRRDEGRRPQYYLDYNGLELHFRKDHFLCPDRECLEKKFVVFGSEIDLKAHQIAEHPNGLTKEALRDARRVDLGGFSDLRERYDPREDRRRGDRGRGRGDRGDRGERSGRGGRDEHDGRGRGRGRDPNAEPIPVSSAQPSSRAETAFQRQMAVQSSSTVARSFGGGLSAPSPAEAYAAQPPDQAPTAMRGPQRPQQAFPSLNSLRAAVEPPTPSGSPIPGTDVPMTPQEQARRLRHQAVTDRAFKMLQGDQVKLSEFRSKISHLKNGQTSAPELVGDFVALFENRPAAEVGSLIKELADIFEIDTKRDELLKAWNDWKALNETEDYPSLPGGSSSASGAGSSVGGKRVLKLKTATTQSARSQVARAGGWGNTQASNLFPALPVARMTGGRPTGAPKTAWAGASAGTSSAPAVRPVETTASRTGAKPAPPRGDAFPALPAAAKPLSSAFNPSGRNVIRTARGDQPSGNSPWGPPGAQFEESVAESADAGRKKGNKNKKQVLMSWG